MKIPWEFILNIILSQSFFAAAQNIIEIFRLLLERGLSILHEKYNNKTSSFFWYHYKDYIRPIVLAIMFMIFGIIISICLYNYKNNKNKKDMIRIKDQINQDINPENIITLLKHYIQYYDVVKK